MDSLHDVFNSKADEFFKDIIEGFPKTSEFDNVVPEFRTLTSGFALLRNVDERRPQKVFRDYVLNNYRDMIANEDERFFLETSDFGITSQRKEHWIDFIDKLKIEWKSMDNASKSIIWKYFKVLVYLSDKCDA